QVACSQYQPSQCPSMSAQLLTGQSANGCFYTCSGSNCTQNNQTVCRTDWTCAWDDQIGCYNYAKTASYNGYMMCQDTCP
ncbi:MAG: hypothetical protein ACREHD_24395, partial [Pirellulales bacterium]